MQIISFIFCVVKLNVHGLISCTLIFQMASGIIQRMA